jgi:ABC-2 type transport system permease protein
MPSDVMAALHDPRARLHSVYERTLHDDRRGLIGWSIGMVATVAYLLAVFPSIRGNEDFKNMLESYPEALRQMFALRDMTTGPGYLQAEAFSFMIPLMLLIAAVLHGSDATAGEEDRGTIDLLLAAPVLRSRVVFEKFAAAVTGLTIVTGALLAALLVGGPLVELDVAVDRLVAVCVASWLLAVDFAAFALLLGAATGRRGLARGVAAALAVASYLVSSLAELVTELKVLRPLSLWYHSLGTEPLFTGVSWGHNAVLMAVAVLLVWLATVAFDRRDLAV